jgi:hypothetical protein
MKKMIPWLTIIGLIITGLTFYYSFIYKEKTQVEIQNLDKTQLTQIPDIKGLVTKFYFNDSIPVKNLWRVRYLIKNIGDKNIIGQGVNSSLLSDGIPLRFDTNCNVLDISISHETNAATLNNETLYFKQWRKAEYVEITAFIECTSGEPNIMIDSRDIISADIIYTDYRQIQESIDKKLIDYFPSSLKNIIKWSMTVIVAFLFILAIPQAVKQINSMDGGKGVKVFTAILMIVFLTIILMTFLWIF